MKVALINQPSDAFVPNHMSASITLWNYEMAHRLSRTCDVVMYARTRRGWPRVQRDRRVVYHRISATPDAPLRKLMQRIQGKRPTFRPAWASELYYSGYSLGLAMHLRKSNADVAHVTNFSQIIPWIRRLNKRIKIVLHMQCHWLTQLDYNLVEPRLRQCDLILGASDFITSAIALRFPHLASRCQTLHNGASDVYFEAADRSSPQPSNRKLVFVGRVSPEKGVHTLLDAFAIVANRIPNVSLDIVGSLIPQPRSYHLDMADATERSLLARYYDLDYARLCMDKAASLGSRVRFVGGMEHTELAQAYRGAAIAVFPSEWDDPFPLVVLEAMATGAAVVATFSGGIPEGIENGISGLLVKKADSEALAQAMIRLLEDEPYRQQIAQAGHERCRRLFTWDCIADQLYAKYERLMSDPVAAN